MIERLIVMHRMVKNFLTLIIVLSLLFALANITVVYAINPSYSLPLDISSAKDLVNRYFEVRDPYIQASEPIAKSTSAVTFILRSSYPTQNYPNIIQGTITINLITVKAVIDWDWSDTLEEINLSTLLINTIADKVIIPNIPSDAVSFNGHSYKVFDIGVTWHTAKEYCDTLGGYLAAITSQEEQYFAEKLISSGTKKAYWLGGTDEVREGEWKWITEETWNYTNWERGEPNNFYFGGQREHYLGFWRVNSNPSAIYKWNDYTDSGTNAYSENFGFICEWGTAIEQKSIDMSDIVYMETLTPSNGDRYTGNEGDSFIDTIGRRNGNIDIQGNSYTHGLTAWVARWNYTREISWVWNEYSINRKYDYLQGKLVLIKSYNETDFDTRFEIIGDGRVLYGADLKPSILPTMEFSIDIRNVNKLIIKCQDNRSAFGGTAFGLADFRLTTSSLKSDEYSLSVLANRPNLTIHTGESLDLLYYLWKNSYSVEDEYEVSFLLSDSRIIRVIDNPREYKLTINGLSEGVSTLKITETKSGASVSMSIAVIAPKKQAMSYSIGSIPYSFVAEWPWWAGANPLTNFYDINGLYVCDFSSKKIGDYYSVKFDVYNESYMYGSVDVYNRDGKWVESTKIDKYSDISSLWDVGKSLYFIIRDTSQGNLLNYKSESLSKKTKININVPDGGCFVISNNIAQSPGCYLYNSLDILFMGVRVYIDFVIKGDSLDSVFDDIVGQAAKSVDFQDIFFYEFHDIALDVAHTASEYAVGESAGAIVARVEDLLKSARVDWMEALRTATNISESALMQLIPTGPIVEAMFTGQKYLSYQMQLQAIRGSTKEKYIIIHAPTTFSIQGITIRPGVDAIDTETLLEVFRTVDTDSITTILNDANKAITNYRMYDIRLTKNGEYIQPNGKVTVMLPIPAGFDKDTLQVYHKRFDSTWELMKIHYDGNSIIFDTDAFSLFAIVQPDSLSNPFIDITESDWFYSDVLLAYHRGLVDGMTQNTFVPSGNLTYSQAVKLAACMHQLYTTGSIVLTNASAPSSWYQSYVDYAKDNCIVSGDYNWEAATTRAGYIEIFANALPNNALVPINNVSDDSIADVPITHPQSAAIYKLYRAGILQGVDSSYNCNPSASIKRSEVATILTRMMNPEKRIAFTIR